MGQFDTSASKSLKIVKPRMGTDAHAFFGRKRHCPGHDIGIAGMETAGNIGGGHDVEQGCVFSHRPRTKAFAHIRIQID